MLEIKRGRLSLKPNYIHIPVTQTDDVDKFNKVLAKYRNLNYNKIKRTDSGGISVGHQLRLPGYDFTVNKWGCELLIIDEEGCFRLQFRSKILDDPTIDERKCKISGRQAFWSFANELKTIGIDITAYKIEDGLSVKALIEKPNIRLARQVYKDLTFYGVNHLDINSAYPAGLKEYRPEFGPIIDKWYKFKQEGHKEYKAKLNLLIGMSQSKYVNYHYADMARYAIAWTNRKIEYWTKWLQDHDCVILLYNTDGIWFKGPSIPQELQSKELGGIKEDHTNCQFRAKSGGAYEFIENGIYTPVIRGHTHLDEIKERTHWKWGDIYSEGAVAIKKYACSYENGVEVIYEKEL